MKAKLSVAIKKRIQSHPTHAEMTAWFEQAKAYEEQIKQLTEENKQLKKRKQG